MTPEAAMLALAEYRERIDDVDRRILALINERTEIVAALETSRPPPACLSMSRAAKTMSSATSPPTTPGRFRRTPPNGFSSASSMK